MGVGDGALGVLDIQLPESEPLHCSHWQWPGTRIACGNLLVIDNFY